MNRMRKRGSKKPKHEKDSLCNWFLCKYIKKRRKRAQTSLRLYRASSVFLPANRVPCHLPNRKISLKLHGRDSNRSHFGNNTKIVCRVASSIGDRKFCRPRKSIFNEREKQTYSGNSFLIIDAVRSFLPMIRSCKYTGMK